MGAKLLMTALLVAGLALVMTSPGLYAGDEGVTVKISGPHCGGCVGKIEKSAKEVEGVASLAITDKKFDEKVCTATLTLKKDASADKVLEELSKKSGFKCELVKAEK